MADQKKPVWPQTPDGTTDWEMVFEDPTSGLIAVVTQAHSPDAIKLSTTYVLQKLFTRRGDEVAREALIASLETLAAPTEDLAQVRAAVATLMREVKDERIEKARVYIERKNSGATIDRRTSMWWKINALFTPKFVIPLGIIFVLALSALVYLVLQGTVSDGTQSPEQGVELERQQTPEPIPDTVPELEVAPPLEAVEEKKVSVPIWLQAVSWPLSPINSTDKPIRYSVTILVQDWEDRMPICQNVPKVMDRIYVAFNDNMPKGRSPRRTEMVSVGKAVTKSLKRTFDDSNIISVSITPYGTKGFRVAVLPPYCKSPPQ